MVENREKEAMRNSQETVINLIYYWGIFLGIPPIVITIWRSLEHGFGLAQYVLWGIFAVFVIISVLKHKLPLWVKISFLFVLTLSATTFSLISWGLIGMYAVFAMAGIYIAAILFGQRFGFYVISIFTLNILIILTCIHYGLLSYDLDYASIESSPRFWLTAIAHIVIFGILVLVIYGRVNDDLVREKNRAQHYFDIAGVIMLVLDKLGNIEMINQKGCDLLGYTKAELIGRNWFDTCIPEDIREKVKQVFADLMAGDIDNFEKFDNEVLCKNGNTILIAWHNALLKNSAGETIGTLSSGENLSEKRESQMMMMHVFNSMPDMVYILDLSGRVLFANQRASEILGISLTRLGKINIAEVLAEKDLPAALSQISWLASNPEEISKFIYTVITADGTEIIIESYGMLSFYNGERVIVGVGRDISERQKLENEAAQLQMQLIQSQKVEAIAFLVSGVFHDLNNLLFAIMGTLELVYSLRLPLLTPANLQKKLPEIEEMIKTSHETCQRASDLIKQLMTIAKRSQVEKETINLQGLIRSLIRLAEQTFDRSISLTFTDKTKQANVFGVAEHLTSILLNLLINARDALQEAKTEEPEIIVELKEIVLNGNQIPEEFNTAQPGPFYQLIVSDNGPGMEPAILERIFESMFTTKKHGTGLGLSNVFSMVKNHNGVIFCTSKPGQGTAMTICLPKTKEQKRKISQPDQIPIESIGRGTILLIDDEDLVREFLVEKLEALGFEVRIPPDPKSGKAGFDYWLANKSMIDLVILDLNMPKMRGDAVLDLIKKIAPDTPVIILTGDAVKRTDPRLAKADGVIFKSGEQKLEELILRLLQEK